MLRRAQTTGQEVTRSEVAKHANCSVQNIGMILSNAKGRDQKLRADAHAGVAAFLKVNAQWLATGDGEIALKRINSPQELSPGAIEIASLYDLIPVSDRTARAKAFNAATTAILAVLERTRTLAKLELGDSPEHSR